MTAQARGMRSPRQQWARPGGRHDRLIRTSNWLIPASIGVLTAFLVMAPLTMAGDVSFVLDKNKVEVAKERLKLQSAKYRGTDSKGQPFELDAGSAVQKSSAEAVVRIQQMAAAIQLQDGPAHLTAPTARYDMDTEKVRVDGPIAVRAPNNYTLDTSSADVDLKTRQLTSTSPVTGTVRQGNFSANSMSADLESRTVRLNGNARLRIVPRQTK
jgi:lipopolysaccharide export system protein LptC